MKYLSSFYHFLGSVYFAIILITSVAVMVMAGTLIESSTSSHRYASLFVYSNPVFNLLLWGFFVNILFAALRRYPYKFKHIPFLITHAGLLMILGGTLIKSRYGIQGSMGIWEGSGSNEIFAADSYALQMEKRDPENPNKRIKKQIPIAKTWNGSCKTSWVDDALNPVISVKDFFPHCEEHYEGWIKGSMAYLHGYAPFAVSNPDDPVSSAPVLAYKTSDVFSMAKKLYLQGLEVKLFDHSNEKTLYEGLLKDFLADSSKMHMTSSISFEPGCKEIVLETPRGIHKTPLEGPQALHPISLSPSGLGGPPFELILKRSPLLAIIQGPEINESIFWFDKEGSVYHASLNPKELESYIVYDQGFGGYARQVLLPRTVKVPALSDVLTGSLTRGLEEKIAFAPPLEKFRKACEQARTDFCACSKELFTKWNFLGTWLLPDDFKGSEHLEKTLEELSLDEEFAACFWCSELFHHLENELASGSNLIDLLEHQGWPCLEPIKLQTEPLEQLSLFTAQIFNASQILPPPSPAKQISKARLLTAFLRAYGIHLKLFPLPEPQVEYFPVETPLTKKIQKKPPGTLQEENKPMMTLQFTEEGRSETISLTYDPYGQGLKWPVLNGKYLVRFQPEFKELPYNIRLRQARQIPYANSEQAFSYECDTVITDLRTGKSVEKTLSMNNVHETSDGFRFYLANITPAESGKVKRVQIVVNRDPVKYWLTYPGAILMTCGIVLLFWFKKRYN